MTGQNLSLLVQTADQLKQVPKRSLREGDCLMAKTSNSVYTILVRDGGWCTISGGWFDKKGRSPMRLRINGCTWGGSVIKVDIAAACGLCLEFSNRLTTSPIQKIVLLRNGTQN
jgi:hypothetical protein